ncbi:hypothetical protein GCM10011581_36710 [Saccharopolyspora subtropica]|uniref:Uncharacterized protein n=1 Tax=Saccharopolyspora thermophila TaxID=89367 RepID=A0A917NFM1_9PSEU|nr:hypothetical protein GCM10011581_36710 [Saccharopolyspora subtropica]
MVLLVAVGDVVHSSTTAFSLEMQSVRVRDALSHLQSIGAFERVIVPDVGSLRPNGVPGKRQEWDTDHDPDRRIAAKIDNRM